MSFQYRPAGGAVQVQTGSLGKEKAAPHSLLVAELHATLPALPHLPALPPGPATPHLIHIGRKKQEKKEALF